MHSDFPVDIYAVQLVDTDPVDFAWVRNRFPSKMRSATSGRTAVHLRITGSRLSQRVGTTFEETDLNEWLLRLFGETAIYKADGVFKDSPEGATFTVEHLRLTTRRPESSSMIEFREHLLDRAILLQHALGQEQILVTISLFRDGQSHQDTHELVARSPKREARALAKGARRAIGRLPKIGS